MVLRIDEFCGGLLKEFNRIETETEYAFNGFLRIVDVE